MVHSTTLQAIVMVYFPSKSLNINVLNLSVSWIFILRQKGTENCGLLQKTTAIN